MRKHHCNSPVQVIQYLHVILPWRSGADGVHDAREFDRGGLDEEDVGGEFPGLREEPVGEGHGDGGGREEEELVWRVEEEGV